MSVGAFANLIKWAIPGGYVPWLVNDCSVEIRGAVESSSSWQGAEIIRL